MRRTSPKWILIGALAAGVIACNERRAEGPRQDQALTQPQRGTVEGDATGEIRDISDAAGIGGAGDEGQSPPEAPQWEHGIQRSEHTESKGSAIGNAPGGEER